MIVRLAAMVLFIVVSGCKTSGESSEIITQEVLVQLNEDSAVADLEQQFKAYQLHHQKVVSRPMNIYLFTYNPDKIQETELIKQLKASTAVKEAQPNNNVQLRN